MNNFDLSRFISQQRIYYPQALKEIRSGRKTSHWMWFIFPQMKGLGRSSTSQFYGISGLEEARAFLKDPVLGANLIEITRAVLDLNCSNMRMVFGSPDHMKLRSSMTLFACADPENGIFMEVIRKCYDSKPDWATLRILGLERMPGTI